MQTSRLNINFFTKNAITLYFVVLAIVSVLFLNRTLPLHWMFFGALEVLAFFYFLNILSIKWIKLSESVFLKRIFWTALIVRIVYVVFSYFLYIWMTGLPFEFSAGDSTFYHSFGSWISDAGLSKAFILAEETDIQFSDMGHPIIIASIYSVFGKYIIIPRLIQAIISAWMVVLLYKLSKRNFGEIPARYAALIALLMPNLIYYCGLHLKETMMVFLTVLFIERADYAIRSEKFNFWTYLIPVLAGASLFLFRTVLGFAVFFAFFTTLVFASGKAIGWGKRLLIGFWFLIAVLLFFSGKIEQEISTVWNARTTNQTSSLQHRSSRDFGNTLAEKGSAAIFAPAILIAPFPTLVNVETQQNQMYLHGGYVVKNILSFFVLIALYVLLFKYKTFRNHLLIISFVFTYLIIIAFSAFALSERFHLPALPFLLVLAGFGLSQIKPRYKNKYIPYLVLLGIIIVGWNIFKLAGRGVVEL